MAPGPGTAMPSSVNAQSKAPYGGLASASTSIGLEIGTEAPFTAGILPHAAGAVRRRGDAPEPLPPFVAVGACHLR